MARVSRSETEGKTRETEDGRRLRGRENRRRIVEAMVCLIREGEISPSAEEVSARANVGLRTVFRHFDDMDSLYRELSDVILSEIEPILEAPLPEGAWPLRLEALVDRRAVLFEKIMPFKVAADVHKHRSEFVREDHAALNRKQRSLLRAALPPAIRQDRTRFEALDLLLGFDSWRRLRQDQRLSIGQAKKVVLLAASGLGAGGKG